MSWKEEQKLEGANTVSSNVDKDGGQTIHEEQTNREQGPNSPLNKPWRFFMPRHQHKSLNVKDTETS